MPYEDDYATERSREIPIEVAGGTLWVRIAGVNRFDPRKEWSGHRDRAAYPRLVVSTGRYGENRDSSHITHRGRQYTAYTSWERREDGRWHQEYGYSRFRNGDDAPVSDAMVRRLTDLCEGAVKQIVDQLPDL